VNSSSWIVVRKIERFDRNKVLESVHSREYDLRGNRDKLASRLEFRRKAIRAHIFHNRDSVNRDTESTDGEVLSVDLPREGLFCEEVAGEVGQVLNVGNGESGCDIEVGSDISSDRDLSRDSESARFASGCGKLAESSR
jgi:hypothetical protein